MHERSLSDVLTSTYFPRKLTIRSPKTVAQYGFAVANFAEFLQRIPRVSDLTDDNLAGLARHLLDERELAPRTVNERVGRLKALWTWLARRGHIRVFPTVERVREPRRLPAAWSEEQLQRLFWSCRHEDLAVGRLHPTKWWTCWHAVAWNTSERLGGLLGALWADLNGSTLVIRAEARKGGLADAAYQLWPETLRLLEDFRHPPRTHIFEWPYTLSTFYHRYTRILRRAGLPTDRRSKSHRMRVSHASHARALTGHAAAALGHASEETTRKHYEDPRICGGEAVKLFIPWEAKRDGCICPHD